ncbi:hypothetical protein A1O1_05927 [Capronia coronata CBS 617.96]|uniref:Uncharacterized protein n=1 Tax=Capronia coronata CBS 617.96 TaxID=1182541 RepID=W9XZA6_9EURO|nr:uncharacterized protein A1O1_05927 [Capronia coronata CBS 617.96]EXJ85563.1 hypothetical protein A1O1_05927 [Capronia coronata CBS 617.96]
MAFNGKRNPWERDSSDASPGKRRRIDLAGSQALTYPTSNPESKNLKIPFYNQPNLDLVSIFSCVAPFRDRLREAGGLTAREYTRLRMTCRTVAEQWRPFPYGSLEADPRDSYFAGLKPIKCEEVGCFRDSSSVAIRRCHGRYHPMAGIFSGCNKSICLQCVWKAQQEHVHRKAKPTEMHYCRPCSQDIRHDNPHGLPQCQCVFTIDESISNQDHSEWQCMGCRSAFYRLLEMKARHNLKHLEAEGRVLPRDFRIHQDSPGLERWIAKPGMNRNNCPCCGRWYRRILDSYPRIAQSNCRFPPPSMLRRCMVCLNQRR